MAHCKNVGGGPGNEDPHPLLCLSVVEKNKGSTKTTSKKKHKRLDLDTERAIVVAKIAEGAERGGHSGGLQIGDQWTPAQRVALERAEARHGSPPRTIMLGGRRVSLEDTTGGSGLAEGIASQGEPTEPTKET